MNAATKEAYKELAASIWDVIKAASCVLFIIMAGLFAYEGDYPRATYLVALTLVLKKP